MTPLDKFENEGGEAWHVSQAAWVLLMAGHFKALGQDPAPDEAKEYHRSEVQRALDSSFAVPDYVRKDYPGIRAISPEEREANYQRTAKALADLMDKASGNPRLFITLLTTLPDLLRNVTE